MTRSRINELFLHEARRGSLSDDTGDFSEPASDGHLKADCFESERGNRA